MMFEREAAKPLAAPTATQLARELRKLRTTGPSSFATLTADNGDYLQVAGSPGGLLLEKRLVATGQHFRAFQSHPVVPFEDGTEMVFGAGRIKLQAGEWFQLKQVVEIFTAFLERSPLPPYVQWRDVTALLAAPK